MLQRVMGLLKPSWPLVGAATALACAATGESSAPGPGEDQFGSEPQVGVAPTAGTPGAGMRRATMAAMSPPVGMPASGAPGSEPAGPAREADGSSGMMVPVSAPPVGSDASGMQSTEPPAGDGSSGSMGMAADPPGAEASGDSDGTPDEDGPGDPMPQGGFPRADEAVNTEQMGPYSYDSYDAGLANPAYGAATMYYPTDAEPPFAAVVFSPGFIATKDEYAPFLGPLLASHGFAILLTTPTSTTDQPRARADDLMAAIEQIARENDRAGSPLAGKLATDRVCATGHSMGGGGSLYAASRLGASLRCALPLQPYQPLQGFSEIVSPTMFLVAENDDVATNASNSSVQYESVPGTVDKYYIEVANATHRMSMASGLGSHYDVQSKYMIAFYKLYLEDDERYIDVLEGGSSDAALSEFRSSL
ncbi:MAG: hypothetical protein OXR73_30350 [Myxococcales bacterium]|nr:hypothetical protein [Myxococcales bacterium]